MTPEELNNLPSALEELKAMLEVGGIHDDLLTSCRDRLEKPSTVCAFLRSCQVIVDAGAYEVIIRMAGMILDTTEANSKKGLKESTTVLIHAVDPTDSSLRAVVMANHKATVESLTTLLSAAQFAGQSK